MQAQVQMWVIMERFRLPISGALGEAATWRERQRINEASALRIVYVAESPYLYVEILGMSAIYDKLLGMSNDRKLEQIRTTYIDIGREDRWHALRTALKYLPHDMQRYSEYIAYLLLP